MHVGVRQAHDQHGYYQSLTTLMLDALVPVIMYWFTSQVGVSAARRAPSSGGPCLTITARVPAMDPLVVTPKPNLPGCGCC